MLVAFASNRALPPGIRQGDCDGSLSPLDDAGGRPLWHKCSVTQQESLSARFIDSHTEELRDAILDFEDASSSARASPAQVRVAALGDRLWSSWIRFRDRSVREMCRRGELATDYAGSFPSESETADERRWSRIPSQAQRTNGVLNSILMSAHF
jgi:hypothetical protein